MSNDLAISVDRDGHRAILRVTGFLDAYTGEQLRAAIDEQIERGVNHVALDASGVMFADSGSLPILNATSSSLEGRGGRLTITNPSAPMARILRITDLSYRFGL